MWIIFFCLMCIIQIYDRPCHGLNFIDLPGFGMENDNDASYQLLGISDDTKALDGRKSQPGAPKLKDDQSTYLIKGDKTTRKYPPVKSDTTTSLNYRRHWLVSNPPFQETTGPPKFIEDKDENIKSKISMLVQQTMHDTDIRMKSVQKLKEKYREEPAYRVGFILSLIKKSRDVLNELFNVAVKHRDEWKALEQLKIFELIVHTNVDTTNLVRQLVEIHIQNLNSTTVRLVRKSNRQMDVPKTENPKSRLVLL